MSSETVVSINALQFTNDNKFAYAYSGINGVNATEETLIEFNTNSEYLDAKVLFYNESGSADDFRYKVKFNNVVVVSAYANSSNVSPSYFNPIEVIIPPFTNVKLTADNTSADTNRNHTAHVYAKVGMPQRVGNE
jgi:hypothetical protein